MNERSVLVAGATGMLGSAVVAALHRAGVKVTSLSRNPSRTATFADTVVLGDATRPDTLRGAFDGVDAVISCRRAGVPGGGDQAPHPAPAAPSPSDRRCYGRCIHD